MGLIKQIDDQMGVLFRLHGGARPVRQHDDRVHVRSRRLSRRPLDGREGPVPRRLGEGAADRLRSVARGRRGARRMSATSWSRRSTSCRHSSMRSAPIRRSNRTGWKAARSCRCCTAARRTPWRPFAISEYDYSMQPAAAKLGVEPRDARLFMIADKKLEAGPRRRLPADAVRSCQRSATSCTTSAPIRPARASANASKRRWRIGDCGCRSARRGRNSRSAMRAANRQRRGILIGVWDEADIPAELWSGYVRDQG